MQTNVTNAERFQKEPFESHHPRKQGNDRPSSLIGRRCYFLSCGTNTTSGSKRATAYVMRLTIFYIRSEVSKGKHIISSLVRHCQFFIYICYHML